MVLCKPSKQDIVAVDILGPLAEGDDENFYILVAGDYFTKWMEAYAIPNMEAVTVARKQMFCCFSPPEQLHSDQGKQFQSTLLEEICNIILGIKKSTTSLYHPQYDGLVGDTYNRTLLIATTTQNHPFNWEDQLPTVCMAYNTSIHAST